MWSWWIPGSGHAPIYFYIGEFVRGESVVCRAPRQGSSPRRLLRVASSNDVVDTCIIGILRGFGQQQASTFYKFLLLECGVCVCVCVRVCVCPHLPLIIISSSSWVAVDLLGSVSKAFQNETDPLVYSVARFLINEGISLVLILFL